MDINGQAYRTLWLKKDNPTIIETIDQRFLPHKLVIKEVASVEECAYVIKEMIIRGAPLIGAMAGYGMYLATLEAQKVKDVETFLQVAAEKLLATRPTAINLHWAIGRQVEAIKSADTVAAKIQVALQTAKDICEEDVEICANIGRFGLSLIEEISKKKAGDTVNILTHCNAGWVATVDWGTATAPIYMAHNKGIKVHVWVDETRPRNQGARITAWELGQHGVPHTVIVDNAGGHLMQHGMVDMCIVGTDRTTYTGDVANKIGTYLKALAAKDNNIPFYVALPSTTIDWEMRDGLKETPIEERSPKEVTHIQGLHEGEIKKVLLTPASSSAVNYGFDVTPARLVTGLITEKGICDASEEGILELFPEKRVVTASII